MKPSFALNLSQDGISLLHRAKSGWLSVGDVSLDAPEFVDELVDLRRTAADLEAAGMTSKVVLPNSQVLYIEVDAPGPSRSDRVAQIRDALIGMTPYDPQDLVFDWRAKGDKAQVAVVARETLTEAESFATQYRFNPVSCVATPDPSQFDGEPFFGLTRHATRILKGGETVEPDKRRIRVVGKLSDLNVPSLTPISGGGGGAPRPATPLPHGASAAPIQGPAAPANPVPLRPAAQSGSEPLVAMTPHRVAPVAFSSRRGTAVAAEALPVGEAEAQMDAAVRKVADLSPVPDTGTLPAAAPAAPALPRSDTGTGAILPLVEAPTTSTTPMQPAAAPVLPLPEDLLAHSAARHSLRRGDADLPRPKLSDTLKRMSETPAPEGAPAIGSVPTSGNSDTPAKAASVKATRVKTPEKTMARPMPKVQIAPRIQLTEPKVASPAINSMKPDGPRPVTAEAADAMTVFGARGQTVPADRERSAKPFVALAALLALAAVALWALTFHGDTARGWLGLSPAPDLASTVPAPAGNAGEEIAAEILPEIRGAGPSVVTDGPIAVIATPETGISEAPLVAEAPAPELAPVPPAPVAETEVPPSVPLPGIAVTALQPSTEGTPPAVPDVPAPGDTTEVPAGAESDLPGVLLSEEAATPPVLESGEVEIAAVDPAITPEAPPAPIDVTPPVPAETAPPAPLGDTPDASATEAGVVDIARAEGTEPTELALPTEPEAPGLSVETPGPDGAAGSEIVATDAEGNAATTGEPDGSLETAALPTGIDAASAEPETPAPAGSIPFDSRSDISTVAPRPLASAPAPNLDTVTPGDVDNPGEIAIVRLEEPPAAGDAPTAEVAAPPALTERVAAAPTPEQAEAHFAATGIYMLAPDPSASPGIDRLDDTVLSTVDIALADPRPRGLPGQDDYVLAAAPAIVAMPPTPLITFDLDDRGLVRATEEGALSPRGVMVFRGAPEIVPPVRPEAEEDASAPPDDSEPGSDTAATVEVGAVSGSVEDEFALVDPATFRDLPSFLDDADLAEVEERAALGGLTNDELEAFRPDLRPGTEVVDAPASSVESDIEDAAVAADLEIAAAPPAGSEVAAGQSPSELVAAAAAAALDEADLADGGGADGFVLAGASATAPDLSATDGATIDIGTLTPPATPSAPDAGDVADSAAAPDAEGVADPFEDFAALAPALRPTPEPEIEAGQDEPAAPSTEPDPLAEYADRVPPLRPGSESTEPEDGTETADAETAVGEAVATDTAEAETAGTDTATEDPAEDDVPESDVAMASLSDPTALESSVDPLIEFAGVVPPLRPGAPAESSADDPVEEPAVTEEVAGLETATEQAVDVSMTPLNRPSDFAKIVEAALSKPEVAPAAAPPAPTPDRVVVKPPSIPTTASVAATATDENALRLNKVNLIGVYGSSSNRRALVRLASGRYVKVQVGDRVDGGKVAAIGDNELSYIKNGRTITLELPKG